MIPLFKVFIDTEQSIKKLQSVFESGYIGQGTKVNEFELKLQEKFGFKFNFTTNSATSAEHLLLHIYKLQGKINIGDEILATPLTCTASNWPILANNFNIKWVDVDKTTLNMDLDDLARKLTPTTKGIMLVHWGGYPCDLEKLDRILEDAKEFLGFKPFVIEDCAHAIGSKYKGKYIGTHNNDCTFSFQAIKHLTCGDGGLVTTNDYETHKKGKLLRWYGIDREENRVDFRCEANIVDWGFKFHMNDINATIGLQNLYHLDNILSSHKDNGKFYNIFLNNINGVTLLENDYNKESSYWIYTILVENRDSFCKYMQEKKITVSRVHERNDKHSCVSKYKSLLPNLEYISKKMICIPVGWWVTKEDRSYIVDTIKNGW